MPTSSLELVAQLPSAKQEAYHYTNLAKLWAGIDLPLAQSAQTQRLSAGQHSLTHHTPKGQWLQQQHSLMVPRGVEAVLIETISSDDGLSVSDIQQHITLEDGARLTHVRLQNLALTAHGQHKTTLTMGRDAAYTQLGLSLGGAVVRYDIDMALQATGAETTLRHGLLLSGTQHSDLTTRIQHQQPHGRSEQLIKTVLADQAQGVYQGQIYVAPHAQKTDAQQQSRALLLSDKARMNTKPELEIFADDVSCSHGAAIGALDDNALFYLQARGIPLAAAKTLLTHAFIDALFEETPLAAPLLPFLQHWVEKTC